MGRACSSHLIGNAFNNTATIGHTNASLQLNDQPLLGRQMQTLVDTSVGTRNANTGVTGTRQCLKLLLTVNLYFAVSTQQHGSSITSSVNENQQVHQVSRSPSRANSRLGHVNTVHLRGASVLATIPDVPGMQMVNNFIALAYHRDRTRHLSSVTPEPRSYQNTRPWTTYECCVSNTDIPANPTLR
jgi:hypothetical protein